MAGLMDGSEVRIQQTASFELPASDADLLRRVRGGDSDAFRQLVDRHGDALYGLAYSLVGNAADAEDVVQETLLGALRRLDAFEERASLKTWLVRILMNQASKLRRSRRVRRAGPLDAAGESGDRSERLQVPSASAQVDRRADVLTMLGALSPEHREVLVLRELQGFSYDEIAETLHIPRGTVESRLYRARQELKRQFAGF